jgi:DNA polymerase-3 subunit alpha
VGEKLTKAMPPAVMGKDIPLSGIFDESHPRHKEAGDFRALYDSEPELRQVVDTARGLEGLRRQWGVHAAGVILSAEPLLDVIPIMRREQDGAIITQLDMGACESLGLLKMDFLGLRNLTILDDALRHIEANRGERVVLEDLPLDDRPTYELLSRGDTLGVFQLDNSGMRALLMRLGPTNFEDISAVLALYRPGPMGANAHNDFADRKNGRQKVTAIHPELEEALAEILGDTYGLIVYQEQVMAIAQKLAGYSLGSADLLRRAMGKKKKEILDKEYVPFAEGMRANGYSDESIRRLWEILVPFSDYAFNKAHTAGYGLVSYWTAYLKANYPAEYMAALLTSIADDKDKSAIYLNECRHMGIKVLAPDVNESQSDFAPVGTDIRFGLSAIRNVGTNVVESIIRTRRSKGRFTDFADYIDKVEVGVCNKRVVESLVKAGAFDSLGETRKGLLAIHEQVIDLALDTKRAEAAGQFDLFGSLDDGAEEMPTGMRVEVPTTEWDKRTLLGYEREMLGLYVSDHPLSGMEHILASLADMPIGALSAEERVDGQPVTMAGLITGIQRKVTKAKGEPWAIVAVEDLGGSVEVMCFPQLYASVGMLLAEDCVVVVRGRLEKGDEGSARVRATDISVPSLTEAASSPVAIQLDVTRCTPPVVSGLRDVLASHPGAVEVHIHLRNGASTTVLSIDDRLRVAPSPALFADLKAMLGPSCLA